MTGCSFLCCPGGSHFNDLLISSLPSSQSSRAVSLKILIGNLAENIVTLIVGLSVMLGLLAVENF